MQAETNAVLVEHCIEKMLQVLKAQPRSISRDALLNAVQSRKLTKLAALKKLVTENRVIKIGRGCRGSPHGYALKFNEATESTEVIEEILI